MEIPVQQEKHLLRDSFSKAIINANQNAYFEMKRRKKISQSKEQRIENLENQVMDLQSDIQKILRKLNV